MKKTIIAIALLCLMLTIALTACGQSSSTQGGSTAESGSEAQAPAGQDSSSGQETIFVHNWGYFIDMDVLRIFEEEYGIRVRYSEFVNNETLYAALNLGGMIADVIIPSDYMIGRMIAEDMLYELNFDNIPNASLIDPRFRGLDFDPENRFAVPYKVGTVGLIYNSAMIPYEITSWGALFDERFAGQILMFDNPRDAFAVALKYLGYNINTTNESEIQEAFELLSQQRGILQAYVMDQIFDKLESGEAWIGPYYAPDFLTMYANNPDLRFVRPVEGTNFFVDAMVIPRGSQNRANAEKFINFMSRTDIALMNMRWSHYASANYEAAAIFAQELDPAYREVVFVGEVDYAKSEVFLHLPQHILDLYDRLWIQLRS
ncbi:MAG: spermidine/putrescine ABC transporter substrate-binding protein [Oscillospiraceae bacterium]|nr:spermidine/putrescine ABC transporter substrate-binding protein [Oscillospiraceae bacterium]